MTSPEPGLAGLRLLLAIADEGALGAAAREVGMAQSNASRAIASLERRLALPLVRRSAQGSELTAEGRVVAEWAAPVVEAMDRLVAGTAALRAVGTELTVSVSMTIAEALAPRWLAVLRRERPGLEISIRILNSQGVIDDVRHGRSALGFVETPDIPADLGRERVARDQLEAVVAPSHPWADRKGGVTLAELAATPLVEREPGSGTRLFLERAVEEALGSVARPRPVAELTSNSAIAASVIAGLGPAVLGRSAVAGPLAAGRMLSVPIVDGPIVRDLNAVWAGPGRPTGAAARLLAIAGAVD
ncbi:MAG: LysR family transcriptional regulator [Arachnia sp.]